MELSLLIAIATGMITVLSGVFQALRAINQKLIVLYQMSRDVSDLKLKDCQIEKQVAHHELFMIRHSPEYIPFVNDSSKGSY